MKYVTASEARKNWFRLLDEVAEGQVVAIRRDDKKLVLRLEEEGRAVPSYARLLRAPDADQADTWGWEWSPSGGLQPKDT
jgi:antitoxin (DNA-binding transcriptional repressor) of toxin-antitoxin stability system